MRSSLEPSSHASECRKVLNKSVRMIVPYRAGNVTGAAGRELGRRLSQRWSGKPIFIVAMPGARERPLMAII